MADTETLKQDVAMLREKLAYFDEMWASYEKMRQQLADVLKKDAIENADIEQVHKEMTEVISGLYDKVHVQGM